MAEPGQAAGPLRPTPGIGRWCSQSGWGWKEPYGPFGSKPPSLEHFQGWGTHGFPAACPRCQLLRSCSPLSTLIISSGPPTAPCINTEPHSQTQPQPPPVDVTEISPGESIWWLLLRSGASRDGFIPSPVPPEGHTSLPSLGELRRAAGLPGGWAAGGSHQRGWGEAGESHCRDRCHSSGCGPPAAPAAGSDGRWHSRWSAGCPGPLQGKQMAEHQGWRL